MRHSIEIGLLSVAVFSATNLAAAADRTLPKPLPEHPGNIFLAGEQVVIDLPDAAHGDAWQAVDYEGEIVADGHGGGRITLGRLPVGYYEVRRKGSDAGQASPVSLGVLTPLKVPTPRTSPIASDVAMAWFYPTEKMPAVASLCALAGLNWIRDRLSWPEVEPQRGVFAEHTRYDDSAAIQSSAGLQVLQVNHRSPSWANPQGDRFPLDLRDAYGFYREIARRWQGKVLALEPWNEADIANFGGHTGSEIATLQKASYLGIKAGNPRMIVCQNVFAIHRPATLADFRANQAWPYFDTFNLHHYEPLEKYAKVYADFRAVSAGRPLWVSECSVTVKWAGDVKRAEPTAADLRVQAERVAKMYAMSLHEGSSATFYFILGHYVEGPTQFGIIHRDLTPRPAFLALAAVGRLLADAKPLGKLKAGDNVAGFVFHAKPDGNERAVLVAWSKRGDATLALPTVPEAVFDHLGREKANPAASLALSAAPLVAVFPAAAAGTFELEPPPAAAPRLEGKPSTVVLQAIWPRKQVEESQSAYYVASHHKERIPIFVYNFGREPVEGRVTVQGPKDWRAENARDRQSWAGRAHRTRLGCRVARCRPQARRAGIDGRRFRRCRQARAVDSIDDETAIIGQRISAMHLLRHALGPAVFVLLVVSFALSAEQWPQGLRRERQKAAKPFRLADGGRPTADIVLLLNDSELLKARLSGLPDLCNEPAGPR